MKINLSQYLRHVASEQRRDEVSVDMPFIVQYRHRKALTKRDYILRGDYINKDKGGVDNGYRRQGNWLENSE